jgi:phosphatidylglycerophosphatase A
VASIAQRVEKIANPDMFRSLNVLSKAIATVLGAGYAPIAPGTCGTALAVPLAYVTASLPMWQFAVVVVVVTVVGIWAADRADRAWGTHDSGRIVIDEVAGYLITVACVARDQWAPLAVGFVVFRVLDIVKPPPVRWLDRNLPGGFGVVLDDVAAGLIGMVTMIALDRFGALARLAAL